MRRVLALLLLAGLGAQAQKPPAVQSPGLPVPGQPQWRRNLTGLLGQTPAKASVRDIEQMEQYMLSAAPYCTSLTPGDYEANRELARQMTAYLMMVNTMATDPQTRAAALRASRAVAIFPCAFPQQQPQPKAPAATPPRTSSEPPFEQKAPLLEGLAAADKDTAADLRSRYESDAVKAAVTWRNADTLRQSLAGRGMSLNAQTAASVNRFQLFFEEAATALREHRWNDARSSLQAVEAETQKVARAVGQ